MPGFLELLAFLRLRALGRRARRPAEEGGLAREAVMREAVIVVLLLGVLAVGAKGLPLASLAVQGRRIEAAVRSCRIAVLLREGATGAGLDELRRVLQQVSTPELLRLGAEVAAVAETDRGSQLLGAITGVLEGRRAIALRWAKVSQADPVAAAAGEDAASR